MLRRSLPVVITPYSSLLVKPLPSSSCRNISTFRPRPGLSVAIVGGGPGGLTLARILQRNGINPSVFEREASVNERSQGGSLDLHHESGLKALKDAGLIREFKARARFDGDATRIQDKTGKVYLEKSPDTIKSEDDPHARPEIDRYVHTFCVITRCIPITPTIHLFRVDLRAILLDSITKDTIQWGRTVKSVVLSDDQKHTLTFTDNSKETYDLVVGADGAWSVVRPLLTPNQPAYTGISFIDVIISDIANRFPSLSAAAGLGSVFSLSHNKAILTQRQSHGNLRIYAALRVPESWSKSFKPTRDAVLGMYNDGWSSDILEFLRSYDESSLVLRNLYALPVPTTWETHPGLTLIGDAAHLMSPFAGEGMRFLFSFIYIKLQYNNTILLGVNQAMQDANELAHAIIDVAKGANTLSEAVKQYEQKMFERVEVLGKDSEENLFLFFEKDAPNGMVDKFKVYMRPSEP